MWVHNSYARKFELIWNKKPVTIKPGTNEISAEIAQALFLYALPDYVQNDVSNFELALKHAIKRFNNSPEDAKFLDKFKSNYAEFLDGFTVTETREELEEMLAKPGLELAEAGKGNDKKK